MAGELPAWRGGRGAAGGLPAQVAAGGEARGGSAPVEAVGDAARVVWPAREDAACGAGVRGGVCGDRGGRGRGAAGAAARRARERERAGGGHHSRSATVRSTPAPGRRCAWGVGESSPGVRGRDAVTGRGCLGRADGHEDDDEPPVGMGRPPTGVGSRRGWRTAWEEPRVDVCGAPLDDEVVEEAVGCACRVLAGVGTGRAREGRGEGGGTALRGDDGVDVEHLCRAEGSGSAGGRRGQISERRGVRGRREGGRSRRN